MKLLLTVLSFYLCYLPLCAQQWSWTEVNTLPTAVSNNAISSITINDTAYIYSFSGIDSSKSHSGIHLKAFKYNSKKDTWTTLPSLPDTLGKIAAGASTVKGKIYILGGYHVLPNGNEVSSDKVHIFDPKTDTYLPDGSPIPIPIDDHIQAVWRDSLIYVITGWSNTSNVADVQIYNPSTDTWTIGTPVPISINRVFGGSGVIIGDTIYYHGGAMYAASFPPSVYYRKGYINPNNPTQITWEYKPNILSKGYRMGAAIHNGNAVWFGGSDITYNYDGLAYSNGNGVPPLDRIVQYSPSNGLLSATYAEIPPVMDLRGIGQIDENTFVIAGGMIGNQIVSNKTYIITSSSTFTTPILKTDLKIFPNPSSSVIYIEQQGNFQVVVFNTLGQKVIATNLLNSTKININHLKSGVYFIHLIDKKGKILKGKFIKST